MSGFRDGRLAALKARIAAMEAGGRTGFGVLPFEAGEIDACLPGGGLPLGQWHEFVGVGMEVETGACPAAFAALAAAPLARRGEAVWILRRDDLFAPGLAGLGFPAERLIQVCARDEDEVVLEVRQRFIAGGLVPEWGDRHRQSLGIPSRSQVGG